MRETSFISSFGTGSLEYKRIQQLTRELRTAIQDDLQDISDHLLSSGMITPENYQDFTNWTKPVYARAANLVQVVLNRIKLDSGHYYAFIRVLEKNKEYYNSILQKMYMYSHDIGLQRRPLSSESQHPSDEESQSDRALLQVSYVQNEDENSPEHRQVRSRPRYPPVKDKDCFNCYCIAILDLMFSGAMFLTFYVLFHDAISLFVLLVTAIIAAQFVTVLFIVGVMYSLKFDSTCWALFGIVCMTCLIFMITVTLLNYWSQHS